MASRAAAGENPRVPVGPDKASAAFIAASVPAALIGAWNVGSMLGEVAPAATDTWQLRALDGLGAFETEPGVVLATVYGCVLLAPLLVASLAVSRLWAELFARMRRRPLDQGWLLWAWLYALLLPVATPVHTAMLGLSFGCVFGAHVFGGTGRYIVSPALLGVLFIKVAYPAVLEGTWLPGPAISSSWETLVAGGVESAGSTWGGLLLGREIGAFGTGSALACLLGAGWLVVRRLASPAIVVAGCLGAALAATLGGDLAWHWHLVIGSFAFALAFIATDPTIRPTTRGGLWGFGAMFGVLTVMLRVGNPEHPEGTEFALMLACLCVPLLDRIAHSSRGYLRGTAAQ